jgi:hypothetical protein
MHGLVSPVLPVLLAVAAGVACGLLARRLGSAVDPFLVAAIFSAVIGRSFIWGRESAIY